MLVLRPRFIGPRTETHPHPARAPRRRGLCAARAPRCAQLLEVLILRGAASEILSMGEGLVSTKGVKFGKVIPATTAAICASHTLRQKL